MVRRALTEIYADPAMVTPERVRRYAELQRFPGNREATLQRARTQEPLDPAPLKRLDVPTLIIWGAQGPLGADRRRLPLPERHQGRRARDLRGARPQPDGRGRQGDRRRGRRLPQADHAPPALPPSRPDTTRATRSGIRRSCRRRIEASRHRQPPPGEAGRGAAACVAGGREVARAARAVLPWRSSSRVVCGEATCHSALAGSKAQSPLAKAGRRRRIAGASISALVRFWMGWGT